MVLVLIATLTSCASSTNAVIQSLQYAFKSNAAADDTRLNPNFRYLRATVDGKVALLVLGYVDDHPDGPIQVWYSADREVVRLQNGRVVGAAGTTTEWRNVYFERLPPWDSLKNSVETFHLVRHRDVMPGYHFGVRDHLILHSIAAPTRSALKGISPEDLKWFEEAIDTNDSAGPQQLFRLPPAKYALSSTAKQTSVVYGEQCIDDKLCFSWQQWPPSEILPNPMQ